MLSKNPSTNQDQLTPEGHVLLSSFVTDTRGPIYVLNENLPMAISAAAMARLSRCADDLRVLLLREFSPLPPPHDNTHAGKEIGLLRRVITAYGDDSVQQLANLYVVVQAPSNLLTKLLERPRIGAAYLEQSTRYILFDQKTISPGREQPHYRYVIPKELDREATAVYVTAMDKLFKNYSGVVNLLVDHLTINSSEPAEKRDLAWRNAIRAQACDAARGMLPAATTSTVGICASGQALDGLVMHLLAHPLQEARDTGAAMLTELRKVAPVFFERTDLPERGGATTAYIAGTRQHFVQLLEEKSNAGLVMCGAWTKDVELVNYWPKLETELVDSLLYPYGYASSESSEELDARELLTAYAGERLNRRHHAGRMFEEPHYRFNFRTTYGEYRDLQRHRLVDAFEWQELDPSPMDFDIPELISEAGLDMEFKQSFQESLQLWAYLIDRFNSNTLAQYAVLFGFKINWCWTVNLREATHIIELRTTPQGHPAYRRICQKMYSEIARVHPILASTISFVNCGEDPELTRLAAERATAYKLEQQDREAKRD